MMEEIHARSGRKRGTPMEYNSLKSSIPMSQGKYTCNDAVERVMVQQNGI